MISSENIDKFKIIHFFEWVMKQFSEAQLKVGSSSSSSGEGKIYYVTTHFRRIATMIIYGPNLARPDDANMDRANCSIYGPTKNISSKSNDCLWKRAHFYYLYVDYYYLYGNFSNIYYYF